MTTASCEFLSISLDPYIAILDQTEKGDVIEKVFQGDGDDEGEREKRRARKL